jgi:hypothetical protein
LPIKLRQKSRSFAPQCSTHGLISPSSSLHQGSANDQTVRTNKPQPSGNRYEATGHISHRMKKRYSHIRIEQKRAAIAGLSRICAEQPTAPVSQQARLTNGDVVAMTKDFPVETVIAKIKAGPCRFNTLPEILKQLKGSGIPDAVLLAMVKAS